MAYSIKLHTILNDKHTTAYISFRFYLQNVLQISFYTARVLYMVYHHHQCNSRLKISYVWMHVGGHSFHLFCETMNPVHCDIVQTQGVSLGVYQWKKKEKETTNLRLLCATEILVHCPPF